VASAEPYAILYLTPRQQPTTQFFTGRMPFLSPSEWRQSTEVKLPNILKSEFSSQQTRKLLEN